MPLRRCVGCGRIAPKSELVRIALARGVAGQRARAVCDRNATMPGRGAYLCLCSEHSSPAPECLARASKRGGIARALRASVTLDAKLVESIGR